jgi:hypothetical protein
MLKKFAKVQIAVLFSLFILIGSPAQAQQCSCGQCYTQSSNYGYDAYQYQQAVNAYVNALGYYSQYNQVYNSNSAGYNTGNSYYDGYNNNNTYYHSDYTNTSVGGDSSGFYIQGDGFTYSNF